MSNTKEKSFVGGDFISKTNVSNLNSGDNFGNKTVLKTIEDHNGKRFAYISGQANRHNIKKTMTDFGFELTPQDQKGEPIIDEKIMKEKRPNERLKDIIKKYPDLDLFGFMQAKGVRRWSILKITPTVAMNPLIDNLDILTRNKGFKTEEGKESERQGSMVQTELNAFNYMHGSFMIDYDRIGQFEDELTGATEDVTGEQERNNRYKLLINGLRYLRGGAKSARLMDDLTPIFVIAGIFKTGTPVFLNAIEMKDNKVNTKKIMDRIKEYKKVITKVYIGCNDNNILNQEDLIELKKVVEVSSVGEVFEKLENHHFTK